MEITYAIQHKFISYSHYFKAKRWDHRWPGGELIVNYKLEINKIASSSIILLKVDSKFKAAVKLGARHCAGAGEFTAHVKLDSQLISQHQIIPNYSW